MRYPQVRYWSGVFAILVMSYTLSELYQNSNYILSEVQNYVYQNSNYEYLYILSEPCIMYMKIQTLSEVLELTSPFLYKNRRNIINNYFLILFWGHFKHFFCVTGGMRRFGLRLTHPHKLVSANFSIFLNRYLIKRHSTK